jgi:phosphatidylserine/phosphatidylglycerophosphate/cardiolipin synthase-like enzyme
VLYRTDGEGSGMHDKFMSIDADHAGIAWLWTGSTNWTQNGLFDDYNNMVFIQDQALALAYRAEFEEMWGGTGPQPDAANSRFGPDKTDNTPHQFTVDGVAIQCYFSPSDGTTARIVDAIDDADHSVHVAMFAFTNEDLGSALLEADQRPGVVVRVDLEEAIYPGTEGWYLESNGVDVATHNTDDVQLHHKYAIIDEGSADDPLVITGSHNWSWYAETINDENTLIIHDATVANLFYQEWHARRNDVVGIYEGVGRNGLQVAPSVASTEVLLAHTGSGDLLVIDAAGRCVQRVASLPQRARLDVADLPAGLYSAVLISAQGSERVRFMVAR